MSPRRVLALAALLACAPAGASHDWVGLDLCHAYPERMPPELDPGVYPGPDSAGARLVHRYCGQCHFPPAPGQHTAGQWAEVVPRMELVMNLTRGMGARGDHIQVPEPGERAVILAYLEDHALRPLDELDQAPPAYDALCGDCHAAPDPAAYPSADWPTLLARMERHRVSMLRPVADPAARASVAAYLGVEVTPAPDPITAGEAGRGSDLSADAGRWLALGPVLLLTLLGLARWWMGREGQP